MKVVRELKNTQYKPRIAILGSRAQMCVHPRISKIPPAQQNFQCRTAVANRSCRSYNNTEKKAESQMGRGQVLDIEELVEIGQNHSLCPFYYSRNAIVDADIVFVPYNYLIDPMSRQSLTGLNFAGSVIIFDEAHNLDSVCGDSSSFDLTATDLSLCVSEVDRAIQLKQETSEEGGKDFEMEDFVRFKHAQCA